MLYGEKTTLRPVEAKDADLINRWLHDPALCGEDVPLAQYHLPLPQDQSAKLFIVQAKGKAIGLMAARWPYGHRTPVDLVGCIADPRERGQGHGSDALVTLLHYLFDTQPVARLAIRCAARNRPARRWLERLGFQLDGIERELFYFGGVFQDVALYGMTRADYDARWATAAPPPLRPAPRRPEAGEPPAPSRERPVRLSPERLAAERPLRDEDPPREARPSERSERRPRTRSARPNPLGGQSPLGGRPRGEREASPRESELDDRPRRDENDAPPARRSARADERPSRDRDEHHPAPRRSRFRI